MPKVSIIITAYNEQRRVRDKLISTLQIDYPTEKIEIIVFSCFRNPRAKAQCNLFEHFGACSHLLTKIINAVVLNE